MNDQTQATTEQAEAQKTTIRPDLNRYIRDKSGSGKRTHRTDDFIARSLANKGLEEVIAGAQKLGIDTAKWAALNPGQQRMLIGNRLRHLMADTKAPLTEEAVSEVYGAPVAPYDAEAAAAAKEAAAAKAAEVKAAAEAKAAEAKAKADAKAAEGEAAPEAKAEALPGPQTHDASGKSRKGKK